MFSSDKWFGASAEFYSETINQSLRFDGSSSQLNITPSSTGNRRTFTTSLWVKRSKISSSMEFFTGGSNSYNTASTQFGINSSDQLQFYDVLAGITNYAYVRSDNLLRDTSNWYHIVLAVDTTQSTASDRVKLYINGSEVSYVSSPTYPSQDHQTVRNNSGTLTRIGRFPNVAVNYFDGYMAEFNHIDGTALDPTSFGETKNGVWIPKEISGLTYGTNGFRLTFADSSSLGDDTSGNGNDFTSSGLASTDVVLDSPTNNFPTFNPIAPDPTYGITTISEGATQSRNTAANNKYSEITFRLDTSNKYYFEYYNISATAPLAPASFTIQEEDGGTGNRIYFYITNTGTINVDGSNIGTGFPTLSAGDIVNIAYDGTSGKIWFGKNGTYYNESGSVTGDPATGSNPIATLTPAAFKITSIFYQQGSIMNFGQDSSFAGNKTSGSDNAQDANGIGDFYDTPPTGFLALCSANLPDVTISPNKSTQADDHFNTVTYSGNSSNTHQITGVGFQPDWLWIKVRNQTGSHYLADSSRGLGTGDSMRVLMTNGNIAEYTSENDQVRSFDADGFTLDDNTDNTWYVNRSSDTYVAWNWKAGGGTTSSNGDGSKTSTVQANTEAGFSIVLYSGDTSSFTVGHGLNSAPEWVIVKSRTHAERWAVFHTSISNQYIYLNENFAGSTGNADERFGNSSSVVVPNSTVVTLGANNSDVSKNGEDYVMYCFHSVEGYSKFGSYTGNGSTDGPFVFTGFRPAWIMFKRTASADSWIIHDNKRDSHNVATNNLFPNGNFAEDSNASNRATDFLSNGFKLRASAQFQNQNGETYIYMAFAEQPFKFSNAR